MSGSNAGVVRGIIDAGRYMTIATADESGRPWGSPVWYAPDEYREFFWISSPDVRHSLNLAVRPEVSLVIFDSTVTPGEGQAVYMTAVAGAVADEGIERGMAVFSARSEAQGIGRWTVDDVSPTSGRRLYSAIVDRYWILDRDNPAPGDHRVEVEL
jgi:hypothetical protein